jgi:hypothetical protein
MWNVNIMYDMTIDILLQKMTLTKTDPSSCQRGRPHKDKTATVRQSWAQDGTRHQDWSTDRQSQCDCDSDWLVSQSELLLPRDSSSGVHIATESLLAATPSADFESGRLDRLRLGALRLARSHPAAEEGRLPSLAQASPLRPELRRHSSGAPPPTFHKSEHETSTPSVSRLSRKCGRLILTQPYGPPQPVTGIGFILNTKFTK